ncbi:MAG: hypothetical protein DRJ47_06775 [Thermoprotei archaeon]|nr:MAG: hypothetical protein DRJ47_06775 [Thermoprotei archaeon]
MEYMVKISKLKEYLRTIRKDRSVLILGPPGVGKSVSVREFAEEEAKRMGKEFVDYDDSMFSDIMREPDKYYVFVDMRLTECEPSDLIGVPRDLDSIVMYKPLGWSRVLSRCAGLLFLDELTNVDRPDIQAVAYKIALDRKVGFCKLHRDVRVVAAGNRPDHSLIAHELPAPLLSRFHVIDVLAPDVNEWIEWMSNKYGQEWDARVMAYLSHPSFKGDFLVLPGKGETLEPFPNPRSWTWLALELQDTPDDLVLPKSVGYLGKEVGTRFATFLRIKLPDPIKLVKVPSLFEDLDLDAKYLMTVAVANLILDKKVRPRDVEKLLEVMASVQADVVVLLMLAVFKRTKDHEIRSELTKVFMTNKKLLSLMSEIGIILNL